MADTPTVKPDKEPFRVTEDMFTLEEAFFSRALAYVTLPANVAFEDCLPPECWVNVARFFRGEVATGRLDKIGARIEIGTEDHAFIATLYVRAILPGTGGLVVECIGPDVDLKTGVASKPHYLGRQVAQTAGYDIRWNVGKREFDIVRQSDRQVVGSAKTREMAADWLVRMIPAKAA